MKGSYRVIVESNVLKFDFIIRRNITIVQGDSGTGKTTLITMLQQYERSQEASGINVICKCKTAILGGINWELIVAGTHGNIYFMDEEENFIHTEGFASAVKKSDNYFVIVTRDSLYNLPYSVTEIYGIRESKKYGVLKQTYNEFYHLYGNYSLINDLANKTVITEDSNSGYEFFLGVASKYGWNVISARGKSNIFSTLRNLQLDEQVIVIADGAAIGPEMRKIMQLVKLRKNVVLYLPESFEWLILKSGVVMVKNLDEILAAPEEYIESQDYFSWERFFTMLLVENTKDSYLQYRKNKLNEVYLQDKIANQICVEIPIVEVY